MNFGSRAGATVGFDINSLSKLSETRANSRQDGTLLHFIIHTIRTKYPETLKFTQELADLKYAKSGTLNFSPNLMFFFSSFLGQNWHRNQRIKGSPYARQKWS